MTTPPIPFCYEGAGQFVAATTHFVKRCEEAFKKGQRVFLVEHQERSSRSHAHYFASLHDAFSNLPEDLAHEFPTFDKFRATALVSTGWYHERRFLCASPDEARRLSAFIAPINDLAIVSVHDCAVVERTAKSQSYRAMNKTDFAKSKDDVLAWAWALVGVDPETGNKEAGRAA